MGLSSRSILAVATTLTLTATVALPVEAAAWGRHSQGKANGRGLEAFKRVLASRLPAGISLGGLEQLGQRALRLTRLGLPVANLRNSLTSSAMLATGTVLTLAASMMAAEGLNFGDAIYYAMTTVSTVGFGDITPHTGLGRAATTALGFFGGAALYGKTLADFVEITRSNREAKARGEKLDLFKGLFRLRGEPIILLGSPKGESAAIGHIRKAVADLRRGKKYRGQPIVLVNDQISRLPQDLANAGCIWIKGNPTDVAKLEAAGISRAQAVAVLGMELSQSKHTLDLIGMLKRGFEGEAPSVNAETPVIVELPTVSSRKKAVTELVARGASAVLPHHESFSSVRIELDTPGAANYFNNLMAFGGDHIQSVVLDQPAKVTWRALIRKAAERGIPVAYRNSRGDILRPENVDAEIPDVKELFFIEPSGRQIDAQGKAALAQLAGAKARSPQDGKSLTKRVVLLNLPENTQQAIGLVRKIRRQLATLWNVAHPEIVIVTDHFSATQKGQLPAGVTVEEGKPHDAAALTRAGVSAAQAVVVLAGADKENADTETLELLFKLKGILADKPAGQLVIAEAAELPTTRSASINRELMKRQGADIVVPAWRAETTIVSEMRAQGTTELLTKWFLPEKGLLKRVTVDKLANKTWGEICAELSPLGAVLRYVDAKGKLVAPPRDPQVLVDAREFLMLTHQSSGRKLNAQLRALNKQLSDS